MKSRILLLCLTTAVVLFTAEALFRAAVFVKTPRGLVFDRELVFRFEPDSTVYGLKLNNIGALGDDVHSRSEEGVEPLRVFLFGGSTSYSLQYVNTLRENLQSQLNRRCAVTSFGRPRYTSHQARLLAQSVFPDYRPDVAVLYLGINDTIFDTFWWVDGPPDVGFMNWRGGTPLLFQGLRYHLVQKRIRSTPTFPQGNLRSERILKSNVENIADLADRTGIQLVLSEFALAVPTADRKLNLTIQKQEPVMRHFWGNVSSTKRAVGAHNSVLEQVAKQRNLGFAPVAQMVPRTSEYFNDICHLTAIGNEVLANTIAATIVQSIKKTEGTEFGAYSSRATFQKSGEQLP